MTMPCEYRDVAIADAMATSQLGNKNVVGKIIGIQGQFRSKIFPGFDENFGKTTEKLQAYMPCPKTTTTDISRPFDTLASRSGEKKTAIGWQKKKSFSRKACQNIWRRRKLITCVKSSFRTLFVHIPPTKRHSERGQVST